MVVGIDVIRSTTTAITCVAEGRRCFPVATLEDVTHRRQLLDRPLLVGELGGNMPYGFDLTNSPVAIAQRRDINRPAILLSSSGTRLLARASELHTTLVACLRNWEAQAAYLLEGQVERVVLLCAGTRGEFREEDQLCAGWIAARLIDHGYAADEPTRRLADSWHAAPVEAIAQGASARYLRATNQLADLAFILEHVNDISATYQVREHEVVILTMNSTPQP